MAEANARGGVSQDPRIAAERERLRDTCGRNIRRLMTAKGWSQSDLARASDLGRDRISKYVRGVYLPQVAHLELIAHALGVRPDELTTPPGESKGGVIRLAIRGDVAVLEVEGLHLRSQEAQPLIARLRRLALGEASS